MLLKNALTPDAQVPGDVMAGQDKPESGMAHDMSNPAQCHETYIRRKFWVALAASVVIVLVSPMGKFHGLPLPFGAAMLVTFVLFGHWMEMKSRRGTSDALQALFKLVPPKARVIRGGAETEVPTAEVVQGDLLARRQ